MLKLQINLERTSILVMLNPPIFDHSLFLHLVWFTFFSFTLFCRFRSHHLLAPWKKSYDKPRQHIKKQRYYLANKSPSSQSHGFSSSHVWMWELDYEESWVPKNWCFWTVVLENTLESPLDCKEIQLVHPKWNQSWIFVGRTDADTKNSNTLATWCKLTHLKRLWCWERLKAGGEGDDRGWDGWMASPTWWMWIWVSSRSWWWTGRPGMLQSMGSQRVRHSWAIELNWMDFVDFSFKVLQFSLDLFIQEELAYF